MQRASIAVLMAVGALAFGRFGQSGPVLQEWPVYAGDAAGTHYSPLADINRSNVARVGVAWEWKTGEERLADVGTQPGSFEATPLMIDDVLYVVTPYNRVVAIDAETGAEKWAYDPKAYALGQPPNGTGFVHRGVAAWRDGGTLRIFLNTRARLLCLDAATGTLVETFGDHGSIDLTKGLRWPVDPSRYTNTSPPVIYKDLVILGNGVGDRLVYPQDPPGDVRAFDAHTGRQVWSFHTVPAAGEPGVETWGDDSWKVTGHTNVWAPFTVDLARGLVYLPVTTPSNDFYGGHRPGQNLYADSLVCLEAATGKLEWDFQTVHHGLWDYDLPGAPVLATVSIGGRTVDIVVQLTKTGFAFVFDRVTGKPIWPIEERPVPPSDVAGEHAWPTQPFPTRPGAISPQGVTLDDAIDFTPALEAQAQAVMKQFRLGPIFTPPSAQGTLQRPGVIGGANWGSGAFDPASGMLYVKTSNLPAVVSVKSATKTSEVDVDYVGDPGGSATFRPVDPNAAGQTGVPPSGAAGSGAARGRGGLPALPLVKPPYGEVVAIDLKSGAIAWRVPFGDTPSVRSHPLLNGVALPARLGSSGAWGVIVTRGGLVIGGAADSAMYALDASTGAEIWQLPLSRRPSATPMTYRTASGRQFIVVATGQGTNAALVALTLK